MPGVPATRASARRKRGRPAAPANSGVLVKMETIGGVVATIGDARAAMRDHRLTKGERAAVRAALQAVQYLNRRFGRNGFDDAGTAVTLLLRSNEASMEGPFATPGTISVGDGNPFRDQLTKAGDRILPRDVALHELAHVVQFHELGPAFEQLHPALAEGIADAMAMLATRDWSVGEGYFSSGHRAPTGTIRDIDPKRRNRPGEPLVFDWRKVRDGRVEEHAAGAVFSRTIFEVQQKLGWKRAEELVWFVIRDTRAWQTGGSWSLAAASLLAGAQTLWPGDAAALAATQHALRVTHLDQALAAPAPGIMRRAA